MTSHKCGVSLLQLTLRSHAATAREKHTFSRWIYSVEPISVFDIFEFSFQECDTLLLLKTQPWVTFPLVPSTTFIFLVYVYIFRYILVAWGEMLWFVIFAGSPVLEIWKWCFGHWLSKGHWNRLWRAPGPHHSCSVCASIPEEERVSLLLQARWWTAAKSTKPKLRLLPFFRMTIISFLLLFVIVLLE